MNEITGKIKLIYDTKTFDSGFKKREFVITTPGDYPQDIKLEALKDNCDLLDKYKEGDEVTLGIDLRGNEYQGKYYVNVVAWKFPTSGVTTKAEAIAQGEEVDDLPF